MNYLDVKIRTPHEGQRKVLDEAKRFNVLDCGRRFGKTDLGIYLCASKSRGLLAEGGRVGWFAPTHKILDDAWREVIRRFHAIITKRDSQKKRIECINGSSIEFWSLTDPDAGRSRKYHRVLVDEAAKCRHLMSAWQEAIRPTLVDFEGDAWFLSTPKGKDFFYQLHLRGSDPDGYPEWMSWQMPTSVNPYIKDYEIDAARRELPENVFKQEFLAEFLDDGGLVFKYVRDNISDNPEKLPDGQSTYIIGCDWAKHNDFSVFTVFNATERRMVEIQRFNQIDYLFQSERLAALANKWKASEIVTEVNSMGEPISERLDREHNLPITKFKTTNASKSSAVESLALAFQNLNIGILNDHVLIDELEAFSIERLPSGNWRYSAPEGFHDDCVMSLVLAWHGVVNSADAINPIKLNFASRF